MPHSKPRATPNVIAETLVAPCYADCMIANELAIFRTAQKVGILRTCDVNSCYRLGCRVVAKSGSPKMPATNRPTTKLSTAVPSAVVEAKIVDAQLAAPQGVPCPNCGCPVESDDKFCPACGSVNRSYQVPTNGPSRSGGAVEKSPPAAARHFRCEQCGAEVVVDLQQRSYACPFCDSTYVVEFSREASGRAEPEFIIGFAITPEAAREKFHAWINGNSWFNPGDLSSSAVADKQRGVYLPFWSFPMLAESQWTARVGEHWQRTETYTTYENGKSVTRTRTVTETEWWPLAGKHHRFYTGYLVSGSKGLPQGEALRIMPFNLPALKRYEPYYLAGWLCEEYSVERGPAEELCKQEYYRQEKANIVAFLPGDTSSNVEVRTTFHNVTSDLCLLPIYVLSYRYQNQLFRFLVNGQTGKIAGDKPISWQRVSIAVGIGLAALALLIILIVIFAQRA